MPAAVRAGRSCRIANAVLSRLRGLSQAIRPGDVSTATRCRWSCDWWSIYDRKRSAIALIFPIVQISSWKVDEHPTSFHRRDRADRLGPRRQGRQGAGRARLVAAAARHPRRPLARRDPQDREERHDADDHEPHEGGHGARAQRRLLHRGGRPAAAGDRRAPRRARAAVHVQARPRAAERVRALRPVLRRRRGGLRRAVGRQRARADGPPRRGARRPARGRDELRQSTASTTDSQEGDSIHFRTAHPHSWRNPSDRPARAIWLAIRSA